MPVFEARIHCSYHPIESREHFDDMVDDVFKIARRINERASYMEEMRIRTNHGVHGLALEWSGAAASPVHFFLSDTTKHFFKGALYFDSKVKPDSLAPISDFIRKDVNRLLASFEWKE
jgi:gliding motility-associated lipoprotein GldD